MTINRKWRADNRLITFKRFIILFYFYLHFCINFVKWFFKHFIIYFYFYLHFSTPSEVTLQAFYYFILFLFSLFYRRACELMFQIPLNSRIIFNMNYFVVFVEMNSLTLLFFFLSSEKVNDISLSIVNRLDV